MKRTYNTIHGAEDKDFLRKMKLTLAELERIDILRDYDVLKRRYFKRSRLPDVDHVAILFVSQKTMQAFAPHEGETLGMCLDDFSPYTAVIWMTRGISRDETRRTLLHEMAHIAVAAKYGRKAMNHGKYWKAEMRRLMRAGAFDGLL